jgi:PTH1 family peptidyl-tRNA hydrolase
MLLIVGLGNPGEKYAKHRHNVGFMAVDAIAEAHRFGPERKKFQGLIREGEIGAAKALTLKPQTFMNDSGQSVGAAMRFYKLNPADVVVFHDELDLANGKIKAKIGGGLAGHNGLKSIAEHIGENFRRVRVGIGHPGDKSRVTGHVLGDFAKADQEWLGPLLDAMAKAAPKLIDGDAPFMNAVALTLAPPKPKESPKDKTP